MLLDEEAHATNEKKIATEYAGHVEACHRPAACRVVYMLDIIPTYPILSGCFGIKQKK